MRKLLFLFNPASGKAKLKNSLFQCVDYYTKKGFLVTVYPTQEAQDAYHKMVALTEKYDLIVCAGGDGTLNEVVSAMLDSGNKTPLGYLPVGSTNDFAHSIGIPSNLDKALPITIGGLPTKVDIGQLNSHKFVYVAAFGAFTKVSYSTPQNMKNSLGHLAYLLEGIRSLPEITPTKLVLSCDDGATTVEGEFVLGMVMNSFSVGGFKSPFHKQTKLNDGMFEVVLVRHMENMLDFQGLILDLMNGNVKSKYLVFLQCSKLTLQSDPIDWTLDGEYGGQYDYVEIDNHQQVMTIMSGKIR